MAEIDQASGVKTHGREIHTDPTKDFFITMITRDISLRDCIFDLLDNSIDGARRMLDPDAAESFKDFTISLKFDREQFWIEDNCGGIRLSDAIDYAFHFGRRAGSPAEVRGGIGLYGIGMKRAIFKIGRLCQIFSEAQDATFVVSVNVDEWERQPSWDFEYEDAESKGTRGTRIEIASLNDGVRQAFGDPGFTNEIIKDIARDYAFFIENGLTIRVGNDTVPGYKYHLKSSDVVNPLVEEYEDNGVKVRILAGLVQELLDEIPEELQPKQVDQYGWFIVCNDRVVLSADKTERTIWGDDEYRVWHPQYNGFAGFVFFTSDDQSLLPWTTTKRELDRSSPLYRRTIAKMKSITDVFTKYTQARKSDPIAARNAELATTTVEISKFVVEQNFLLPTFVAAAKPDEVNVNYKRLRAEIEEIRSFIGNRTLSARDIGVLTFEYYRAMELGK